MIELMIKLTSITKRIVPVSLVTSALFMIFGTTLRAQTKSMDPAELQVLTGIIVVDSLPTVHYKTIVSEMNQPLSRHLFYLKGFDLCSSLVDQDEMTLGKEERDYLVERFATMEVANLNKLVREPKNHTLKKLEGHDWSVISLPVVFRDGTYAIYYSKGEYSGQFVLMKNIDGSWKEVCYASIWSE